MPTTRASLLASIAKTIADYRAREIDPIGVEHIELWVKQFPTGEQDAILAEMNHVLTRTYFSHARCEKALETIIQSTKIATPDPKSFWKTVNFLRIQSKGESQRIILSMFEPILKRITGLRLKDCGSKGGPHVYLDDCLFTGNHVRWDLVNWVKNSAPTSSDIRVIALALHTGRVDYPEKMIRQAARDAGKQVSIVWKCYRSFIDWYAGGETTCLQPESYPDKHVHVKRLLRQLETHGRPAKARAVQTSDKNKVFSSESGRIVLEQAFLRSGCKIKYDLCPHLQDNQWPLGYDLLKSPGFGSLVVTFRNCPNNCPLAVWAGDPWTPLFPRKTNTESSAAVPDAGGVNLDELLRSILEG